MSGGKGGRGAQTAQHDTACLTVLGPSRTIIFMTKLKVSLRDYNARVLKHMADYKAKDLGIEESGRWRGKEYAHILPFAKKETNILEPFRDAFWKWKPASIKLHQNFPHLNSSQALCFNLFFPFKLKSRQCGNLLQRLNMGRGETVNDLEFEKTFLNESWHNGMEEGTNFDCYARLNSGTQLFFELKFTEAGFGAAKQDEKHLGKLKNIYGPRLKDLVKSECLTQAYFCRNYQLLRNISYLNPGNEDLLFLIFPRANTRLEKVNAFLADNVVKPVQKRIKVIYLEELITQILETDSGSDSLFTQHFKLFQDKYCLD